MDSVKMALVSVLRDGMDVIVQWKVVQIRALVMVSVVLIVMHSGSAGVTMDGMEKTVVFFLNKIAMTGWTMTKVINQQKKNT